MRLAGKVAGLLVMLAMVAGCTGLPVPATGGENSGELTPVELGLGFIPNVQFAPFYVGIEQGFFREEGIDLSLSYGYENDYLKLVGVGETQFMVGSGDQVVLGRAQGLPVTYVFNWYTRFPVVVFAKADRAITTPADLAGKKIGIPGAFGASYVALRGILEAAGLDEQAIQLESIGFTQAAAVLEDKVEAAVDYAVNGPVVLSMAGTAVSVIGLDDYLVVPANGLVTNERTIAEQPQLVAAMARALQRSIAFTLANPDEAFANALAAVPEAGGENEATSRAVFDASLPYWTPQPGKPIGESAAVDWQAAAELMERIGLVDRLVPAEELFTNQFVPGE
ncbi:MAG: ABC transporter substrate-binding protein [Caldilinea sp.]|jgi:NitT/TauT family transport system substrate-binding protein